MYFKFEVVADRRCSLTLRETEMSGYTYTETGSDISNTYQYEYSYWDVIGIGAAETVYLPANSKNMFSGIRMEGSEEINCDMFKFDNVDDASYMFADIIGAPKIVGLKNANLANCTTIEGMFARSSFDGELDLSDWTFGKECNALDAFKNTSCPEIKLDNWNNSMLSTCQGMFSECRGVQVLNLKNWYVNNLETSTHQVSLARMFADSAITEIVCDNNWRFSEETLDFDTFEGATFLPGYSSNKISSQYCISTDDGGYFSASSDVRYYYPQSHSGKFLYFWYDEAKREVHFSNTQRTSDYQRWGYPIRDNSDPYNPIYDPYKKIGPSVDDIADMSNAMGYGAARTFVTDDDTLDCPTQIPGLFRNSIIINGDFYKWNFEYLCNISYAFNLSSCTDSMLNSIRNIKSYSPRFFMDHAFTHCNNLENINLQGWVISLQDASQAFHFCTNLKTFKWGTGSKVGLNAYSSQTGMPGADLSSMFADCYTLQTIDLSATTLSGRLQTIESTFSFCSKLEHIYVNPNHSDWAGKGGGSESLRTFQKDKLLPGLQDSENGDKAKLVADGGYFESLEPVQPLYYWYDGDNLTLHLSNKRINSNYLLWSVQSPSLSNTYSSCLYVETDDDYLVMPLNITRLFQSCYQLENIDTSNWDMRYVENASYMFVDCQSLQFVEGIENWSMQNCKTTAFMFSDCISLEEINLRNWSNGATSVNGMFNNCSNLTDIKIGPGTFQNVTNVNKLFYNCSALPIINLSPWIPTKPFISESQMFGGCSNLKTIYVNREPNGGDWTSSIVEPGSTVMFDRCSKLPNYSSNRTTVSYAKPVALGGYFETLKQFFVWYDEARREVHFSNSRRTMDYVEWIAPTTPTYPAWRNAIKLINDEGENGYLTLPLECDYLLYGCTQLGNWGNDAYASNWFMEKVRSMDWMVPYPAPGVEAWHLPMVTHLDHPFGDGRSLISELSLPNLFNSSNSSAVISINNLICNPGITSFTLSGNAWNTKQLCSITNLCKDCPDLVTANIEGWVVNQNDLETITGTFENCTSLVEASISFPCYGVTDLSNTFKGCRSLKKGNAMFFYNGMVNNLTSFYEGCTSLEEVDLSEWQLSTNYGLKTTKMFADCVNLERIFVNLREGASYEGGDWTPYVSEGIDMFKNDVKLPEFDSSATDGRIKAKLYYNHGYFYSGKSDLLPWWHKFSDEETTPNYWHNGQLFIKEIDGVWKVVYHPDQIK